MSIHAGLALCLPRHQRIGGHRLLGASVYAYKQFGERIYHGSNRIVRVYCHDVRRVTSASQLRVDMAIFEGARGYQPHEGGIQARRAVL